MSKELENSTEAPCQCGAGKFVLEAWVPDHGWKTNSRTIRERITCSTCSQSYSIVLQNGSYCVVTNQSLQQQKQLQNQVTTSALTLAATPEAKQLLADIETLLSQQPSTAAIHRLLFGNKLTSHFTVQTFRKHWKTPAAWLRLEGRPFNYRKIASLLGGIDPTLDTNLKNHEHLERQARQPLNAVKVLVTP